jgi:hypothetical protein
VTAFYFTWCLTLLQCWRQVCNVENNDPGPASETLDHLIAETTASTCDDDELALARIKLERRARPTEMPELQSESVENFIECCSDSYHEQIFEKASDSGDMEICEPLSAKRAKNTCLNISRGSSE